MTLLCSAPAMALAPEHEVRRLMLATESAVENQRWDEASGFLNRLQGLDAEKPDAYLYYRGRVMAQAGLYAEARSALENYIGSAGSDGQYYTDALKLITDIEQKQKADEDKTAAGDGNGQPIAMIEPAGGDSVDRLRQLYLADSDAQALEIHLNTLLELTGWREDERVVRVGQPPDILYRVSADAGRISIQETRRAGATGDAQRRLSVQTLSVYGIDPDVKWDCRGTGEPLCRVYDPRDGSRLFQLAYDRDRVAQVARTLGQLIRTLQNPD
ncbi:tetratricopeptide repeat protein [Marinobacter sp.]|uniref:tetratricopeptide repeat protein n=1 Tax=Marinobacter sp. TaxID=50741 RepID=UPI00385066D8